MRVDDNFCFSFCFLRSRCFWGGLGVREEIIFIGLPVPEYYIGYISHPVTSYKTYETYLFYCSIVIQCVKYVVKAHKD